MFRDGDFGHYRDDMPADRAVMEFTAARFNKRFRYRWDRVIDFLKLHYILSERRDTEYWRDHQDEAHVPGRLRELLSLWKFRAPSRLDFEQTEEIFPHASYQYVLYGMGFQTQFGEMRRHSEDSDLARRHLERIGEKVRELQSMQQVLEHLVARCHGDERPECPILDEFGGEGEHDEAAETLRRRVNV